MPVDRDSVAQLLAVAVGDALQVAPVDDKAEYARRAAVMIRAGVAPGLRDEVVWWRSDDLWFWALEALVLYARAAAERLEEPVAAVCGRIASRYDVQIAAPI